MSNTLKVKLKTSMVHDGRSLTVGDTVELSESFAVRLAVKNQVEPINFDPWDEKYSKHTEDFRGKYDRKDATELPSVAKDGDANPDEIEDADESEEEIEDADESEEEIEDADESEEEIEDADESEEDEESREG